MTRRRDLEQHRTSLAEIRDIMNSMKTLAYMETRKLARFLDAQHAVVQSIEDVAIDLLAFYPDILPETKQASSVYLLIGTERGFCGDFNHALVRQLETTLQTDPTNKPMVIAIGHKLHLLLEEDARLAVSIEGASVAEEVTDLLSKVVEELMALQTKHGSLALFCLYHNDRGGVIVKRLLPPFHERPREPPRFPHPPQLNLPPRVLLAELTEHYLFAALHEILYASLNAENHSRVTHLEGAVKHLDDEASKLVRQSNILRQEEIIEEIEVILLSTSNLDDPWLTHRSSSTRDSTISKNDG